MTDWARVCLLGSVYHIFDPEHHQYSGVEYHQFCLISTAWNGSMYNIHGTTRVQSQRCRVATPFQGWRCQPSPANSWSTHFGLPSLEGTQKEENVPLVS